MNPFALSWQAWVCPPYSIINSDRGGAERTRSRPGPVGYAGDTGKSDVRLAPPWSGVMISRYEHAMR
jgi:hypothetical protein